MLKMVDGTGIIGVDMICPLGVSTPQPPNYDRVELEGTGMLVLPNSLDAPLERLELGGKTDQVQTTGKNLANPSEFVVGTIAGDTGNIIKLKQYIATGYIPVIPGKRYSTSCGNNFLTHTIFAYDKEKTKINSAMNMSSEMPEGAAYIRLSYRKIDTTDVTESDMEELKKVCMVNEGSTALSYEPYTGGKPSPSLEYQQEIKSVGRLNEDTGKYEVDAKVTGKNLFDKDSVKKGYEFSSVASDMESPREGWFVSDFISVAEGKVYISGKSTGGGCKLYNKDKLFVKNIQATSGQLTIEEGISYFRLNGETKDLNNIQVELGSVSTTYEPYRKLQTITITSDRPITKWDKLVEQGGEIGWLYKSYVGKMPKTGYSISYKNDGKNYYFRQVLTTPICDFAKQHFNCFENGDASSENGIDVANIKVDRNRLQIALADTSVDSIQEFESYLQNLGELEFLYRTSETEFIPLPQSEQNAIRALKTYYPTTVITADGGELDPDIKVTYRKEI